MRAAARGLVAACVVAALVLAGSPAHAQGRRDSLLNGTLIGAGVGAAAGVAFTHAVRDSDLGFGQYAYGGLIFGAIGAGIGVGVDALLNRTSPRPAPGRRRPMISPAIGRDAAGMALSWRW